MCMMVSVSDEVALRPVREDDLALLEDLTQNPEKTGEFECAWRDGVIYSVLRTDPAV
jgi:RimJ/RimL family protein N-acetyltransferase